MSGRKYLTSDLFTFPKYQKWISLMSGCGAPRTPSYTAYVIFVFVLQTYFLSTTVVAVYVVLPNKILSALALHMCMICMYIYGLLVSRHLVDRTLRETNEMVISGIFEYEEEDADQELINMRIQTEKEIQKLSNIVVILFFSGAVCNLILFPIFQFFLHREKEKNDYFNPYLPPFFSYIPFNTRTVHGYIMAYLITVSVISTAYCITLSINILYIHTTVKLKGHLQILNYSLSNIHKRAYLKYKRIHNMEEYDSSEELFEKEDFQACLNSCLTANIKHHHALNKFRAAFQPIVGAFLLDVFITIAFIYAALFYLILQKLPLTYLMTFMETLLSEQSGLFLLCVLGEAVSEESQKVFETLYGLPWTKCNMKINRSVKIMMSNTLQPFKIKTLVFDSSATLTTYGDLMVAVYKIMNVFHQSEI